MTPELIAALIGAALVGGSLGLLGSGGAILTVPLLVYVVGHPEKSAIVESYAIVGAIAVWGVVERAPKDEVNWRAVLSFGPASMIGALLGATIALHVPGVLQLVALGLLMLAAAVLMARPPKLQDGAGEARSPALLAFAGAGVGALTGLLGIGGGFLYVPALVILGGLKMKRAVGASLALIALSCATSFARTELAADPPPVDWLTVALFIVVGVLGASGGQRLSAQAQSADAQADLRGVPGGDGGVHARARGPEAGARRDRRHGAAGGSPRRDGPTLGRI
jgi:uncharacterized membrane protein YfcA